MVFGVVHRAPDIVFLKIADLDSPLGHGGHAQLLGLVDRRIALDKKGSTFDHLAFEIPLEDFNSEKERIEQLGLETRTKQYAWSRARALFFRNPQGNLVEFICTIARDRSSETLVVASRSHGRDNRG